MHAPPVLAFFLCCTPLAPTQQGPSPDGEVLRRDAHPPAGVPEAEEEKGREAVVLRVPEDPGPPLSLAWPWVLEDALPEPPYWEGSVNIGASRAEGNARTDSVSATLDAVRRGEHDRLTGGAGWFFARQRDPSTREMVITERKQFGALKYDYFLSERWYASANAKAEGSKAANLSLRATGGLGLGHQFVEEPHLKISGEAGVAYVHEKFRRISANEYISGRLANAVEWNANENLTYAHNIQWLPSLERSEDQLINVDAKVQATLTESMFMQFQVLWDWDNTPAPGLSRSDTRYLLSVGWKL